MTKLTHEEIDAMEAGQKMNTLVAKLVMEWDLCVHQMNKGWDTGVHFDHNKNQPTIKIFHGDWKPSIDIAAAWQVLEHSNLLDNFDLSKDYDYEFGDNGEYGYDEWTIFAHAPTFSLAVCRAALKLVTDG